ncbi:hypothetical protein CICLE_v10003280mg [Citrus x clementina]|uniref:Uncharacterized protein n=2 Tax=Citrus TaxID=2706 RepID=V4SDL8_CITCL|nr:hypothetical protein CICLE_v10003280mg [Citrus x clementina]GAY56580.1 hypothetical protein CUMW_173010 [Citrus unshiu]
MADSDHISLSPSFLIFSHREQCRLYINPCPKRSLIKADAGYYHFKNKTHQDEFSPQGLCKASMFAFQIRSWLIIPVAIECCGHPWMREAPEDGFCKWHADYLYKRN